MMLPRLLKKDYWFWFLFKALKEDTMKLHQDGILSESELSKSLIGMYISWFFVVSV